MNITCVYEIKHIFLRCNTTTYYTYSSAVNHVRFLNLFHRMGRLVIYVYNTFRYHNIVLNFQMYL
jgi:hypothetical protein